MYARFLFCLSLLFSFCTAELNAQTVLLQEDFNNCVLPTDWEVRVSGSNLSPQWYVGFAQNPAIAGQSIDSTCFLFIDDDAGGTAAADYVLEFVSPAFDGTAFTTVACSMDVHFRFGATDFLQIIATDGSTETLLARFDNFTTNYEDLNQGAFFKLRHDLALVSSSPETRLIIRYTSPTGSKGRYAGIDNISVVGSGTGVNVVGEAFNFCQKPAGWETEVVSGQGDWTFGRVPFGSSAFYEGNSMNGSCFVFFDDNAQGDTAPPSLIRLRSPWFSGTQFFEYELTCDAIMRYSGFETFSVFLENDKNETIPLFQSEGKVFGPFFPDYGHFSFDLSPFRSAQLRVVFEYNDGATDGYWTGIDNVKVTGRGPALDFCSAAVPLLTDAPCVPADNSTALLNGPASSCADRAVGGLWFQWQADFTGIAKLTTRAEFNDVVSIFTGGCADPQELLCDNRDEHGFTGETTYFAAQAGTLYYVRVSGRKGGFGEPRGQLCIGIERTDTYPARPVNDDCATAQILAVDNPCSTGNNRNAAMSPVVPTHNRLARADVWYYFVAPNLAPGELLEMETNADFAHIVTLYRGTCNALTEMATNHHGGVLQMPALTAGQTYFVQVAGVFATVEGNLCPRVRIVSPVPPANDDCLSAIPVSLNTSCVSGTNLGATFSGIRPACAVSVDRDVWFKFQAPAFGSVQISTGAAFEHTLAIWEGACNDLRQVFCATNPLPCNGYVTAGELNNGQTYYLQIASRNGAAGLGSGAVCLKIRDGALPSDYVPIGLEIAQLCVGVDSTKLLVTVSGGTPPYGFSAGTPGQIVPSGMPFGVVVQDAMGCQAHRIDTAKACAANVCTANIALSGTPPSCFGEADGALSAGVTGGTGPFFFEWSNHIFTANNANLPAGVYLLTVAETTGCVYTATAILEQPDSLFAVADDVQHPVQGQSNGSIQVTLFGGTPPLMYSWYRDDSVFVSGLEDLEGVPGGTYTLYVMDANDCWDSLSRTLTETVGTQQVAGMPDVSVFPNPASERVIVSVSLPAPQTLGLTLTDVLGRVLQRQQTGTAAQVQVELDVRDLPAGLYLLQVQGEGHGLTRRIVVWR
ncbi:MAG: T9SS type A sorting domain-containing protein [Lewinellaceae bacterium]|nr:T9SS type A sorting domain-containing protein [Lewinellaceae bacterium]